MDDETAHRIARNEQLVRQVNEAIARGLWPGEQRSLVPFRCECARLDCNHTVDLTVGEYERVRQHPRRFVLVDGHGVTDTEAVVETARGHVVVEKAGEAGAVADATNPRD